jgi:putative transcriptional regulator
MAIRINLDVMLAKRKMSLTELAGRIGLTLTGLSLFKTGKSRGVRFTSLNAICRELNCQPGDILEFIPDMDSFVERQSQNGEVSDYDRS